MAEAPPLLVRGGRIIDPDRGLDQAGDVLLLEGRVAHAGDPLESVPEGVHVVEASGLVACPGFVDLHVHLREPGREDAETIATGTEAAARGGYTTVCGMPNTDPAIDSAAGVAFVREKAWREGAVRVLPVAAVTRGRAGRELADLEEAHAAGAVAFSDDGAPVVDPALMRSALLYLRGAGVPVIDHCEDPGLSRGGVVNEGRVSARLGLPGIPVASEMAMVSRDLALAEETGGRLHLAHVSTRGAVELVRRARERGVDVTAEASPHHLTLSERAVMGAVDAGGEVEEALGLEAYDCSAKVNPPLRSPDDVGALVEALREGVIGAVATDHAPHTPTDKLATYEDAPFGISGLETALGVLLGLVHRGELALPVLVERLTCGPARMLGEAGRGLGTLREGAEGDVAVFDPNVEWVVDPGAFASKGRNTPFAGVTVKGRVRATVFGGRVVYRDAAAFPVASGGAQRGGRGA